MNAYEKENRIKYAPKDQLIAVMQGQSDAYPQWMALAELNARREQGVALAGEKAKQQLAQGKQTVKDRRLSEMLPELLGIGQLPAPNMEELAAAEGGIMSYADGGSVEHFEDGGFVVLNGVKYPIDPATGKVMYKGLLTDPRILQQSAKSEWNTVQPMRLSGADYKPSTQEWLGQQNVERDTKYFADQKQMREDIAAGKGINWKGNYYPIIQEGANKGRVDYNGVPTKMNMFPGAEGAIPAMPADTPWKSDTAKVGLEAVLPSAPAATDTTKKHDGAPGTAPGVDKLLAKNEKAAPAALRLSQPGTAVEDPTKSQERTRDQRLTDIKEILKTMRGERGDEFAAVKEQLQEDKKDLEKMKSDGLGYMLLSAAGAGLKPGQSTASAIGSMLGSFGETGMKYQHHFLAARQGISSGQQRLAEAQAAADRGDMQTAATLAGHFSTEDIARAKMAQDYKLGMAQLDVQRAAAGRNTELETLRAVAADPNLAAAHQQMHGYAGRELTPDAISKSYKEYGMFVKNPVTGKIYTPEEWAASQRRIYGSMNPTSSLSAEDQALVNKYNRPR